MKLIDAAKHAVEACQCSARARLSGHLVGCYAPELEAAIAEAEQVESRKQEWIALAVDEMWAQKYTDKARLAAIISKHAV